MIYLIIFNLLFHLFLNYSPSKKYYYPDDNYYKYNDTLPYILNKSTQKNKNKTPEEKKVIEKNKSSEIMKKMKKVKMKEIKTKVKKITKKKKIKNKNFNKE